MLSLTELGPTPVNVLGDREARELFSHLGWTIDDDVLTRFTASRTAGVRDAARVWMGLMTFQPFPSSNFNRQAAARAAARGLRLATQDECASYLLHHARRVGQFSVYAQGDGALKVEGDCLNHVIAVMKSRVTTVITNSGTHGMLCLVTGPSRAASYRRS